MTDSAMTQVGYAKRGSAAWITLQRPDKRNALTPVMVDELNAALDLVDQDRSVRAVVITGAGTAFCAGADLEFFRSAVDGDGGCEGFVSQLLEPLHRFLSRLKAATLPVIAAVNGACAAGGLETVLCCDLIVAARNATFSDAHSRRGLAPALGGAAGLVASVGARRATQLLFLADAYDAETMARWGLINEVTEPGELDDVVQAMADTLSRRSPASIALMKQMVRRSTRSDWDDHVAADLRDFETVWRSSDLREGLHAYVERRPAVFAR